MSFPDKPSAISLSTIFASTGLLAVNRQESTNLLLDELIV
jgi:hypothetical protein